MNGMWRYRFGVIIVALLMAWVAIGMPFSLSSYRLGQVMIVFVYAIAVLGLNLIIGYGGAISLGHSAFFALGAYTTAVLVHRSSWPFLATLPVTGVISWIVAFLYGLPALRLRGLYLALATLALAVATPPLLKRFVEITGGSQGIVVGSPESPAWTGLTDDKWLYYVILIITSAMFVMAWNLVRGGVGRALLSVRDNEVAAQTMGVKVSSYLTFTFALSAMYAGVAGGLYTMVFGFVAPDSFGVPLTLSFFTATVLGGSATLSGAVYGALIIEFLPVFAADINPALSGFIYGVMLIVVIQIMPDGIAGLVNRAVSSAWRGSIKRHQIKI